MAAGSGGFSTPAAAPPKIGPTLAPDQVDPAKRKEIEALDAAAKEIQEPLAGIGDPVAANPEALPPERSAYSEEDKKAFVRAILGDKPFAKTYTLFGDVRVTFVDSMQAAYNTLPNIIRADIDAGLAQNFGSDDVGELVNRYLAALTVRDVISASGKAIKAYKEPAVTKLHERVAELLMLPRPLFLALVNAASDFDSLINGMVERAAVENFWRTGG